MQRQLSRHPRRVSQRRRASPRTRHLARRHFVGRHACRRPRFPRPYRHHPRRREYPVHFRHHRLPQRRASYASQPAQQRHGDLACPPRLRAGPYLRSSPPLPLLRIGDRLHGVRGHRRGADSAVRPIRRARHTGSRAPRARHGPVRRAHHVYRRTRPSGFCPLRSHQPAHRRDGGRAMSHRSHAHRRRTHALPRDDHRLRPDREFAGDHHVPRRRPHGASRHHRRRGPGKYRSAHRRSRIWANASPSANRASSAPAATWS